MTSLRAFTEIVGADHAMIGADTARWAQDWTGAYIGAPGVVLRPADTAQVAAILRKASELRLSVTPVSGNTGLVGGAHTTGGVLLSLDRMSAIREVNPRARTATVEAGVILSSLQEAAEAQGLIFPLTFGARGSAMIGGVLSTNAGGSNVLRYGNARDLCLGLEAVLADVKARDDRDMNRADAPLRPAEDAVTIDTSTLDVDAAIAAAIAAVEARRAR